MSVEKPVVIGFDGLHRVGKGTQADMLHSRIVDSGGRSIVVRGDGTREGLGLRPGDPYSEEWQARGERIKSPEANTVENWNAASYLLAQELARHVDEAEHDAIIVDRTLISRAAFLLHRGVGMRGERLTLDELYPDNAKQPAVDQIDLQQIVPDVMFDLQVKSPRVLLGRLDTSDPKYQFRSRNIKGGFDPAAIATQHLPADIERRVVRLDGSERPDLIHERVVRHLGGSAIARFLHS